MKLNVLSKDNEVKGSVELPVIFSETIRVDLIQRSFRATASKARQAYGSDPRAGRKHSDRISKKRRDYRGCYGKGIARTPRKVMTKRGTQFNWVGATAPNTVGGARAFGPRSNKIYAHKLNKAEKRKALRCALAATLDKNLVKERGHKLPENYPFVLDSSFEKIKCTKNARKSLANLKLTDELKRVKVCSKRSGKGKLRRGLKKRKIGPLIVVSKPCELTLAARNIPGINVVCAKRLSVSQIAPGAQPIRLTLFTESALDVITKERLFQ